MSDSHLLRFLLPTSCSGGYGTNPLNLKGAVFAAAPYSLFGSRKTALSTEGKNVLLAKRLSAKSNLRRVFLLIFIASALSLSPCRLALSLTMSAALRFVFIMPFSYTAARIRYIRASDRMNRTQTTAPADRRDAPALL